MSIQKIISYPRLCTKTRGIQLFALLPLSMHFCVRLTSHTGVEEAVTSSNPEYLGDGKPKCPIPTSVYA